MGGDGAVRQSAKRLHWWGSALIGLLLLVAISLPVALRFGQGSARYYGWYSTPDGDLYSGLILDQVQYTRLVDSTSGRAPSTEVAPFTARALAPWLAGKLPLAPHIALTLVNLGCLTLGTFALARLAMDLTRRRSAVLLAVLVWSVSFPVAKYTGDAFVDPAAIGLVPVVLLAAFRRYWLVALGAFAAAVWMKETSLVMLPVGLSLVWLAPAYSRGRRLALSASWLVVAALAYATADLPGGPHSIVFAPWVPESVETVSAMLRYNLLTPPRVVAFAATALPALLGVLLWWRGRRQSRPVLEDREALPLVVGCVAGALIGLAALPTALLDGRSVWTTLPMGALLLGGWWASREPYSRRQELGSLLRVGAVGAGAVLLLWVAVLVLVPLPGSPEVLGDEYRPRFAGVPTEAEDTAVYRFDGEGGASLEIPGEGPVAVAFDADDPLALWSDGTVMVRAGRVNSGMTMFDPESERVLQVESDGRWNLEVRPLSSALFWEHISPITGEGPNVIVYPGGLPRSLRVSWDSDDPQDRVMLVGGCHLGSCGQLDRDGVVPAGTEALVVDASGAWDMAPDASELEADQQAVLQDTSGGI